MARVKTFYHFLSASAFITDNNLETPFYLTQALFNFWNEMRPGRPEARDVFIARPEVDAYENFFKSSVFDPIANNHQQLRES